jgi:hypothetical protein
MTNLINHVRVRGQKVTNFTQETATGDGTTTTFTLSYKPVGTVKVSINGTEQSSDSYTVDVENKQITFNTAPSSGASITFDYSFLIPIVVEDQDEDSINTHGDVFKEIEAPFIDNFSDARRYARMIIDKYSDGETRAKGYIPNFDFNREVGEIVTITDNVRNITKQLVITRIVYDISKNKTEFDFGEQEYVLYDWQMEVMDRLKKLERRIQEEDQYAVARVMKHKVSTSMKMMQYQEFSYPRDSFILGHPTLGRLRTNLNFEPDCSDNGHHGTWSGTGIDGNQYGFNDVFDNLVSYYTLNEAEGTTVNDSKGTNNGTNNNATIVDGKYGDCLEFDGSSSYVDFGDITDFEFGSSDFSIEAWVYPDVVNTSQAIFSKYNGSADNNREFIFYIYSDGKLGLNTYSDGTSATETIAMSSTSLSASTWQHVVVVKSGTNVKFYINGTQAGTGSAVSTLYSGTSKAILGAVDGGSLYFDGKIDNVRIYSDALDEEEIKELYDLSGKKNFRLSYGIFNGSDRKVTIPHHTDLDGQTDMTISLAVRYDNKPSSFGEYLIDKWNFSSTGGWAIRTVTFTGADFGIEFFYRNASGSVVFNTGSSNPLSLGKFYHIAFTKSGANLKAYIDGVLVNSTTASQSTIGSTTNDLVIGYLSGQPCSGMLDEIRIYHSELSQSDIQTLSNKGDVSGAKLYISFDNPRLGNRFTTRREYPS